MWDNISFDYSGASVLVTGGTGGIGAAVANAFCEAGAEVTITGTRRSLSDYDDIDGHFSYRQLDVEDKASIDTLVDSIPRLDVLVNSAGVALLGLGLDEYEPDNFDRAVAIHLTSVYRLAAGLAPKLAGSRLPGGASVISMASMSSYFGIEVVPGYGAGKTGLLGLTRVLAVRWARQNIRVNALAVGMTWSKMTSAALEDEAANRAMLARVPLGRHGTPDDVAGAALFLSSAAAAWITGQSLAIDGGFTIAG